MIFDTHTHYDDSAFDDDREILLSSFEEKGIGGFIAVAASKKSLETVPELVARYPFACGALGLHPDEAGDFDPETERMIEERLSLPRMVAVGEIGLDYHWMTLPKDKQREVFEAQIDIAVRHGLPIIVHSREAAEDTYDVIRKHYGAGGEGEKLMRKGVIHAFSYSVQEAMKYISLGFYIGVGGVVTYKNGRRLKETVAEIPLDRIVLETDCPYLPPAPHRGERNSSLNLPFVVSEIASLKGISPEEVEEATFANAKRLFGL